MRLSILSFSVVMLFGCSPEPKTGSIVLQDFSLPSVGISSIGAWFAPESRFSPNCTRSTVAGCKITECDFSAQNRALLTTDNAGAITTTASGGSATLHYGTTEYDGVSSSPALWAEGDTITVSSTGGTVPPFTGKTVTAPHPITLISPACDSESQPDCGSISRSSPLTISWTGGVGNDVMIGISSNGLTAGTLIECTVSSGPATIDPLVVAKIRTGDSKTVRNGLNISSFNQTEFTVGDYDTRLEAHGAPIMRSFTTSD